LQDLATAQFAPETAAQVIDSGTLLTRTFDARFGFVHQSVAEWLVAWQAAHDLNAAACRTSPGVTVGATLGGGALAGEGDRVLRLTRLSDLTIEFLCGLADPDALRSWIAAVTASPASGEPAQANALAIRGHLELVTPRTLRLIGHNLRGRRFAGEDLRRADLTRADLTEADLTGARLDGAILRGANLTHARLDGAHLVATDLTGADLTACRLLGADLTGAQIDNIHWDRTALIGATLDPTELPRLLPELRRTGSAPPDGGGVTVQAGMLAGAGVGALTVTPSREFLVAGGTGHHSGLGHQNRAVGTCPERQLRRGAGDRRLRRAGHRSWRMARVRWLGWPFGWDQ
jgi:hypothetical protein